MYPTSSCSPILCDSRRNLCSGQVFGNCPIVGEQDDGGNYNAENDEPSSLTLSIRAESSLTPIRKYL
jgi:hypothetical protein